jgi:nitrate reductase beta subunit
VEQGLQPRCVESCIGKIRLQGWLSKPGEEQADNPIDQLVHIKKIALPLYPQYGTEPNVYYIPPIHVPRDFLLQMFGPGVETAIENYMAAKNDMAALASMMMFGNTPQIITRYEYDDTHATGYNEGGDEVVKVPMTEPFIERNHYDEKYKAYRLNTA